MYNYAMIIVGTYCCGCTTTNASWEDGIMRHLATCKDIFQEVWKLVGCHDGFYDCRMFYFVRICVNITYRDKLFELI